jgi:hypothetical protein
MILVDPWIEECPVPGWGWGWEAGEARVSAPYFGFGSSFFFRLMRDGFYTLRFKMRWSDFVTNASQMLLQNVFLFPSSPCFPVHILQPLPKPPLHILVQLMKDPQNIHKTVSWFHRCGISSFIIMTHRYVVRPTVNSRFHLMQSPSESHHMSCMPQIYSSPFLIFPMSPRFSLSISAF